MSTEININGTDFSKQAWKIPGVRQLYTLNEVYDELRKFTKLREYEYDIGIGTDSQLTGQIFRFISVISIHRIGKGGLYFYRKFFEPRNKFPIGVQKMRMFHEVACSIELGFNMKENTVFKPVIHIDASPPSKTIEFTSKFSEQLRGYVQGSGFMCKLKPESYIAHAIADRHSKVRTRKQRHNSRYK